MHHNRPEEFIGVDVGSRRVGLARGSSLARIAEPLTVVAADKAVDELAQHAAQADGIVVGLPRGLDGQETAQTKAVRQWVKQARAQINRPFYWQDEALTSLTARQQQVTGNKQQEKTQVDAQAAAVILQDFLNTSIEDRVTV